MEWQNTPESTNIDDRRGAGGGMPIGGGTGGLGLGAIIIIVLISYFTGIDPRLLLGGARSSPAPGPMARSRRRPPIRPAAVGGNDPMRTFVAHVLGETEAVWAQVLPAQKGVPYVDATLVLYSGATTSGCGGARAAMGPFYCPVDKKVYLDMSFFRDMQTTSTAAAATSPTPT